jgi:hypothetical protein
MLSLTSTSGGPSPSRIARPDEQNSHVLTAKAEEILLFAEAHSLREHPDFQPLSLFPKDMTFPSYESTPYYSEWSPSPEQHHDPMHPVAISLQGDVVNRQRRLPMPGMDLPPKYPDHSPLPSNHLSPLQPPADKKNRMAAKLTGLKQNFQLFSLFPEDMTVPSSPAVRGRLVRIVVHESAPYYSEWSPSSEQHHDSMHPVAMSFQGDVVNPQHLPMPGMDLPPHSPDHSPLPINHVTPSQPPLDGKNRMGAKSTELKRTAEKTPASKKVNKSEVASVVIPPRPDSQKWAAAIKDARDTARASCRQEITWHPSGKWVSCIEGYLSVV